MGRLCLAAMLSAALICCSSGDVLSAQGDADLESVLDGFEEDGDTGGAAGEGMEGLDELVSGFEGPESGSETPDGSGLTIPKGLSGHLKLSGSAAFAHDAPKENQPDHRGITRLVPEIMLEYKRPVFDRWKMFVSGKAFYDLAYTLKGRGDYPDAVLAEYEQELEIREAYIEGSLTGNLDIKIGRQIVVWGKSDNIRVADVINPLDQREPGVTDIEDLRLPAAMTRVDYYTGKWALTGLIIHEAEFNKNPVPGNDFFTSSVRLPDDAPGSGSSNTQYGLAWQGFFTGWDLSFYWADVYNRTPWVSRDPDRPALRYSRVKMAGGALAVALGNYLFTAETAYFKGLEFHSTPDEKDRLDLMVGIEYQGITDTTITLELVNRHLFDFETAMEHDPDRAEEDRLETAFRFSRDFMNETLNFTGLLIAYGDMGDDGAMARFTGEYDVNDNVSVKLGVIFYASGNLKHYDGIGDNDRVFAEIKYGF
ncbi:MAG: DUF1302 family protein [Desulfobacterales bacterium]|nr:DUF1302 family protein [Desulfobacterales bacterium]